MSRSIVQIILAFGLFMYVSAQEKSNSEQNGVTQLPQGLAVIIGVISACVFVILMLLAYAKFCHATLFHQNFQEVVESSSGCSGFDKEAIESLPFFRFGSLKGSKEGLECAVCISGFEDTETLRLLPKCKHAFHISCIDKWLESQASCPLCRCKFNLEDFRSLSYSNSFRFSGNPSNLTENLNLEIVVEREEDLPSSSSKGVKREKLLVQEVKESKQKNIVSDVLIRNRWSDVSSSDLLCLKSEMLSVTSSNKLTRSNSTTGMFNSCLFMNENLVRIKEDIERKRLYESKIRSHIVSANSSKSFIGAETRSKSEITNLSRFTNFYAKDETKEGSNSREERKWKIWLRLVRNTVQWLSGQATKSQETTSGFRSLNV